MPLIVSRKLNFLDNLISWRFLEIIIIFVRVRMIRKVAPHGDLIFLRVNPIPAKARINHYYTIHPFVPATFFYSLYAKLTPEIFNSTANGL
jgi:hypothetical protein